MSSTFTPPPPAPTFSPPPDSNSNNNNNSSGIGSSASLYLYTFLATLVLLLGVSSAIVTRSFILRRRQRRMVEEAIRNGTWVPPAPRDGPAALGTKPVLFEAYLVSEKGQNEGSPYARHPDVEWDALMPFSASHLHPSPDPHAPAPPPAPPTPLSARLRTLLPRPRRSPDASMSLLPLPVLSPGPPSPAPPSPNAFSDTHPAAAEPTVRVAVLIAMPAAHGPKNGGGDEDEDWEGPPHVEFGVVEVPMGGVTPTVNGDTEAAEDEKRLSEESALSAGSR